MPGILLDTSVHLRRGKQPVAEALERLDPQRLRYRCAVVELELLRATDTRLYADVQTALRLALLDLPMTEEVHTRAVKVQGLLVHTSQHAGVQIPDLLIAACAEVHDITLIHYDADFDAIAAVTGQATEWIVPRGTADHED